jgi:pimeloyl-ACP methyl ester carboxylesterase
MDGETEILPGPPPCVVHHRYAMVNGLRIHYVEAEPHAGTVKGKARLCCALHGFPEFWYSWRHQIPALAAAGFHVIAPDLRGYNLTDKPKGVNAYRLELLLGDVTGLIEHAGKRHAVVVGHDWGGAIAWALAMCRPEYVHKLVVLNAPHPAAFVRELRRPGQWLRSWYILFFQLPLLPEWVLRAGNYARLERTLRRQPVHRGAFTDEDIRRYKEALERPGALTAALNYYRAALRRPSIATRDVRPIQAPTLLMWGVHDRYLGVGLTEGLSRWVRNIRIERIQDASHWLQCDTPGRVNELMVEFLQGT